MCSNDVLLGMLNWANTDVSSRAQYHPIMPFDRYFIIFAGSTLHVGERLYIYLSPIVLHRTDTSLYVVSPSIYHFYTDMYHV